MIRAGVAVLTAAAVLVALILIVREQRQQATELARLKECVAILERNQAGPPRDLAMGCPIYN